MFEVYQDPASIPWLISIFSILTNFSLWLTAGYLLRIPYFYKTKKKIQHKHLFAAATVITFLNWLGMDINLWFIIPSFLALAYFSYHWITTKSIRWINLSMSLFTLFIISTYTFFNYKIHYITYVFFTSNDILEYAFQFKPYFLIYHPGDFLAKVSFVINQQTVEFINEPLHYRIYLFYYALNFIGLMTWLWIYFDVLKKHKFKFDEKVFQRGKDDRNKKPINEIKDIQTTINNELKDEKMNLSITSTLNELNEREKELFLKEQNIKVREQKFEQHQKLKAQGLSSEVIDKLIALEEREQNLEIKEKELELKELKLELTYHPIFKSLKTMEDLQIFMQQHIYAVWDFMALLKRLQRDICSTSVPWKPIKNGNAARLINEIVVGEESDELPGGGHASHFDIYIQAMKEVGANTQAIESFVLSLERNDLDTSLNMIPQPAQTFVRKTLNIAMNESLAANLGSFFNGRENVIPPMFSALLKDWSIDKAKAPMFHYYLVRHIELDGDEHGPAGEQLIHNVLGDDKKAYLDMLQCSIESVRSRLKLWDDVLALLKKAT